jgi:DnaJ-like protein
MPNERACLSTLRGVSARAAAILDRYADKQALWVPVAEFKRFLHTLHWGNFEDLDCCLLAGLDDEDRAELIEELRAYNAALRRQRERVDRFHYAYRHWLDQQHELLPPIFRERLRSWQQRFGPYDYFRVTGLGTQSGLARFLADPEGCMGAFEQTFIELEERCVRESARQRQAEADWWASVERSEKGGPVISPVEAALNVLGFSGGASFAEIRRAYRARAKALHPDRQGMESTEQMAVLNRAYTYLRGIYRSAVSGTRSSQL